MPPATSKRGEGTPPTVVIRGTSERSAFVPGLRMTAFFDALPDTGPGIRVGRDRGEITGRNAIFRFKFAGKMQGFCASFFVPKKVRTA